MFFSRRGGQARVFEGLRAMADRLFRCGFEFAEGPGMAGGLEDRIVTEATLPARRPDEAAFDPALEKRGLAVRPGRGRACRRKRRCGRRRRRSRRAGLPPCPSPCTSRDPARPRTIAARPSRPCRRRGRPPSATTSRPLSSASAGRPEAVADASALSAAFCAKVVPVSSGSGRPSDPAETGSMP